MITSAGAVSNGGPANSVNLNLGSSSGDSSLASAVYRFANPANNFSANITLNNGAVVIANGSVAGNFVQGTQKHSRYK